MKKYYTILQPFDSSPERSLSEYLDEQGMKYSLGGSLSSELREANFRHEFDVMGIEHRIIKRYEVLLDEHELSGIKLTIENLLIIDNSPSVERKNKFRKMFSWMFN
jgi:hypothetical protein